MASIKFKNVYLNDYKTIIGPMEKESHLKKAGTPTMGDVIFILSTTIAMFIVSRSLTD